MCNTTNRPALPFAVWIAAVDLLCREAWQVDAYTVGPQPWQDWHESGWAPDRALLELSTPTTPPDIEDDVRTLAPIVANGFVYRRIMHATAALPAETIEIALRYLDIEQAATYPVASREEKARALVALGITVQPGQTPLDAWVLAMCRENDLPAQLPAVTIGEAARELCPAWLWWLA